MKYLFSVLVITYISCWHCFSQHVVEGYIYEENYNKTKRYTALKDVSIFLKGSKEGVLSYKTGYFKINVPNDSSILIISLLGYKTQEINLGAQKEIKVFLLKAIECYFLYPYYQISLDHDINNSNYGFSVDKGFDNIFNIPIGANIKFSYRSDSKETRIVDFEVKKYYIFSLNKIATFGAFLNYNSTDILLNKKRWIAKESLYGIIPQFYFKEINILVGWGELDLKYEGTREQYQGVLLGISKLSLKNGYYLKYFAVNWGDFWKHQLSFSKDVFKGFYLGGSYEKIHQYEGFEISISYKF